MAGTRPTRPTLPDSAQEAAALRAALAIEHTPVAALPDIAAHRGARLVERDELGFDGYTYAGEDGLVIEVKAALPESRRRFTIAHEIGHTFFFQIVHTSAGESRYLRAAGHERATAREEGWCHNFAGDLLIPDTWLREDIGGLDDPSIDALVDLAARYGVSLEPLVNQLARYRLWPTIAVFVSARRMGPIVRRVYTNGRGRTHLRPGQPLPDQSTPARAAELGAASSAREDWLTIDGADDYLLECKRIGADVLTLVHVEPGERTVARLSDLGLPSQRLLFQM